MSLTPITHPAGSQAMLRGTPGTIRQWLSDGVALFFPQRGHSYRAQPGELAPIPALPPFEAWAADRIASVTGIAVTRTASVHDDYLAWCAHHQVVEEARLNSWHFAARMRSAGYEMTKRLVPTVPGGTARAWCNVWKVALHAEPLGRAA